MSKKYLYILLPCLLSFLSYGQYDQKLVKFDFREEDGNPYGIIKLNMKNEKIKLKYFASKSEMGEPIMDRFNEWSFNKNLVLFSSETYYFYPNKNNRNKNSALPVGLCFDNGIAINKVIDPKLDGLVLLYPSGHIVVENLKNNSITFKRKQGPISFNLKDQYDRMAFFKYAQDMKATVFQTHLFVHDNKLLIGTNANSYKDYRRFLAGTVSDSGDLTYYVINLPFNATILEGSVKAQQYLKSIEKVKNISFLINLDTGAQNTLNVFHPKTGKLLENANFSGTKQLKDAINLLAFYYE